MPQYTQANRLMAVSTPLGTDVLLLQQVSGAEAVSRLFRFQLEFLAESSTDIAFDQILGQSVTVIAPGTLYLTPELRFVASSRPVMRYVKEVF